MMETRTNTAAKIQENRVFCPRVEIRTGVTEIREVPGESTTAKR